MREEERRIAIGSDHAGFQLKRALVEHLVEKGYDVNDVGPDNEEPVDYPDIAAKVGQLIERGSQDMGILICGSGLGVAICANKFPGVRAVTANDPELARLSRAHNDANILALGARFVEPQAAREIVDIWLATEFEGGRHQQRVDKISALEREGRG